MVQRLDVKLVEGLDTQIGLLLEGLEVTSQEWREELDEVSEEMVIWQPGAGLHSIGVLILHIADVEAFWLYQVATGAIRDPEELQRMLSHETDQYKVQWPDAPRQPLSWYLAQHDAVRARTQETIRRLNNPEHLGHLDEEEFTLRWLLHHVMIHEAYHGGQAVLLALIHAASKK